MRLYHVSTDPHMTEMVVYPRVPKYRLLEENNAVARICMSASIVGCLCARRTLEAGDRVYVYRCETDHYVQPTAEQVEDVAYTGELWVTEAVKIEYFQELLIHKVHTMTVDHIEIPFYEYEIIDQ